MAMKLIVCDIDGTLVDRRDRIHKHTMEALKQAVDAGILLSVATGRAQAQAQEIATKIGSNAPMICCNGAVICDEKNEYFRQVLNQDLVMPAIQLAQQYSLGAFLFSKGGIYLYLPNAASSHEEYVRTALHLEADRLGVRSLHDVRDLDNVINVGVEKIFFASQDARLLARARLAFENACHYCKFPDCAVTSSLQDNFELMPKGVNKGSALTLLAAQLGVERAQIIAFGDNENDVELLRYAGLGVAMGNASPGAIAAADIITDPVDEGGVGNMIQRILTGETQPDSISSL